ncbi:MAG: hypothetical protein ACK4P3_08655 [Fimbriimonadaceae bacterium]
MSRSAALIGKVALCAIIFAFASLGFSQLDTLRVSPAVTTGGNRMLGTVSVTSTSTVDVEIQLTSGNPNALIQTEADGPISQNAVLTIPGGSQVVRKTFLVITRPVPDRVFFTITARLGDRTLAVPVGIVPGSVPYTFLDLGVLAPGNSSEATALNNSGVVVGNSFSATTSRAFSGNLGGNISALQLFIGAGNSAAYDVNSGGAITGWVTVTQAQPGNPAIRRAAVWNLGLLTELGTFGGRIHSEGAAINSAGQVTGFSYNLNPDGEKVDINSFSFSNTQVIPNLGFVGHPDWLLSHVDDSGQIYGHSLVPTIPPPAEGPMFSLQAHRFRVGPGATPLEVSQPSTAVSSGRRPWLIFGPDNTIWLVNADTVVGSKTDPFGNATQYVLYTNFSDPEPFDPVPPVTPPPPTPTPFVRELGRVPTLALQPGVSRGQLANSIVPFDQWVVGTSSGRGTLFIPSGVNDLLPNTPGSAYIGGELIDLNSFLPVASPWEIQAANDISEFTPTNGFRGAIVGRARNNSNNQVRGFVKEIDLSGRLIGVNLMSAIANPSQRVVGGTASQLDFTLSMGLPTENAAPIPTPPRSPVVIEIESLNPGVVTINGASFTQLGLAYPMIGRGPDQLRIPGTPPGTGAIKTQPVSTITEVPLIFSYRGELFVDPVRQERVINLTVVPLGVAAFTIEPRRISSGQRTTGRVEIDLPRTTDTVVTIASNRPTIARPVNGTVTIPAGTLSAEFPITSSGVIRDQSVTFTASFTDNTVNPPVVRSRTAPLEVVATGLASIELDSPSVFTGTGTDGTITLNGPMPNVPEAERQIVLQSDNPGITFVPPVVTVPVGAVSVRFRVNVPNVNQTIFSTITAVYKGDILSTTIQIRAITLDAVTLQPSTTLFGTQVIGRVRLTEVNPETAGTRIVQLQSSNQSVASVPASVAVVPGQQEAEFIINVTANPPNPPPTSVVITATLDSVQRTATLNLVNLSLQAITTELKTVVGGTPMGTQGTFGGSVRLSGNAPPGGVQVTVSSTNPDAAGFVSAIGQPRVSSIVVNIPGGSNQGTFIVQTVPVAATTNLFITAVAGGQTLSAGLTVLPASLQQLLIQPVTLAGGQTSSVAEVRMNGPVKNTTRIFLFTNNQNVLIPPFVDLPAGSNVVAIPGGVSIKPISSAQSAIVTAQIGSQTISTTLNLVPGGSGGNFGGSGGKGGGKSAP